MRRRHVDMLFVDEAGQLVARRRARGRDGGAQRSSCSATRTSCRRCRRARIPKGSGASVLEHLLGEHETHAARPWASSSSETWRMRPELCAFTSDAYYEGRLEPAAVTARAVARRRATGSRFAPGRAPGHARRRRRRREAVAAEIDGCSGRRSPDGRRGPAARPGGLLVVAPYNAQVRALREATARRRIRVGTVDKFQGQQAPVVFVSMASSTGEDVPRGLGFLFSRAPVQRRDLAGAVPRDVVACPRLLEPTAARSSRCGS